MLHLQGYWTQCNKYIGGEPLNFTEDLAPCDSIVKALSHFSQFQNSQPGALSGFLAFGFLWTEGDWILPSSAKDIENCFNTRET
jgi:hypothetical protein